jgi:beta-glucosidase
VTGPMPTKRHALSYPSSPCWKKSIVSGTELRRKAEIVLLTCLLPVTTGVGWQSEKCVGNVGEIPRLGFRALCLQDSPLGIRFADFASAFPAGVTVAATWDRAIMRQQGVDMGTEHKMKGIDVQLGPVVGPIGRVRTTP